MKTERFEVIENILSKSEFILFKKENGQLKCSAKEDYCKKYGPPFENLLSSILLDDYTSGSKPIDKLVHFEFIKVIEKFIKDRKLKTRKFHENNK